jgi:hypothetical protein
MRIIYFAGLIALGFAMSGCATIVKGTTQSLSIKTPPVDGAKCTLTNSEGTWFLTSPGSVVVHKTKNDLQVGCTKDGYQDVSAIVPAVFHGTTAGNIIFGGLAGIAIDAASGANYEYPPVYELPMTPVTPPAPVVQPIPDTSGQKPNS